MKGLILKEFYLTWHHCKVTLAMVLFFFFAYFEGDMARYFVLYPALCMSLVPTTLCGIDEKNKWENYALSLPISKSQFVSSKYIVGLILNIITIILMSINYLFHNMHLETFTWELYFGLISYIIAIAFLSPAVSLPFIFKYGVEKGRTMSFIVTVMICVMGAGVLSDNAETIIVDAFIACICLAGFAILAFFISWFVSIRFYNKRDF